MDRRADPVGASRGGHVHLEATSRSVPDYDPSTPVRVVGEAMRQLSDLRRRHGADLIADVQEIFENNWLLVDHGLVHTEPVYSVPKSRLKENWERQLSEKQWVDIEAAEWALLRARILLVEGHQGKEG
jgi:hypothetical protein